MRDLIAYLFTSSMVVEDGALRIADNKTFTIVDYESKQYMYNKIHANCICKFYLLYLNINMQNLRVQSLSTFSLIEIKLNLKTDR